MVQILKIHFTLFLIYIFNVLLIINFLNILNPIIPFLISKNYFIFFKNILLKTKG
jgi:hypothetical protein